MVAKVVAIAAIATVAGGGLLVAEHLRVDTHHVPYVVGMKQADALRRLERAHVRWRFDEGGRVFTHPPGGRGPGDRDLVIHQNPGGGTRTSASTVVTLSICSIDPSTGCIDARITGHRFD
jgi:beta-lactam-binding protein with PASTA domain